MAFRSTKDLPDGILQLASLHLIASRESTTNHSTTSGGRDARTNPEGASGRWLGSSHGAELREGSRRTPLQVRTAEPEALALVASRDHAGPLVR
jgi:hypothetical protein